MSYIDGFLIPVPKAGKAAYLKVAADTAGVWTDHGATAVMECWGDDLPEGKLTDFFMAVKAKPDETVVFSWIVWPSRAARDAGNAKVMADPRMAAHPDPMPFDGARLIMGGFETILEA